MKSEDLEKDLKDSRELLDKKRKELELVKTSRGCVTNENNLKPVAVGAENDSVASNTYQNTEKLLCEVQELEARVSALNIFLTDVCFGYGDDEREQNSFRYVELKALLAVKHKRLDSDVSEYNNLLSEGLPGVTEKKRDLERQIPVLRDLEYKVEELEARDYALNRHDPGFRKDPVSRLYYDSFLLTEKGKLVEIKKEKLKLVVEKRKETNNEIKGQVDSLLIEFDAVELSSQIGNLETEIEVLETKISMG